MNGVRSGLGDRVNRGEVMGVTGRQGGWLGEKAGGGRIEATQGEVACEQEQE